MRFLSWNVNGLRSALGKGILGIIKDYDVVMFQEVKSDVVPLDFQFLPYYVYLFPARKRGYSGTMTLSRQAPLSFRYGIGREEFDSEGRVITLEFPDFYVVNAYFPNSGEGLRRLQFKLSFDEAFQEFVGSLRKPLVVCGDFNVAHEEIDIARPEENEDHAGFTREEREWFHKFLLSGFVDTFRMFVKEGGHYSWWSYRTKARERNVGWRIDYCLVSAELAGRVRRANILEDVMGSDHAPITLQLE